MKEFRSIVIGGFDPANAASGCDASVSLASLRGPTDEAIQGLTPGSGLLRGACRRAALGADPLARNDEVRKLLDDWTVTRC
jgi:hypothetical protein